MMNTLKKPEELPDVAHYITVTFDEFGFSNIPMVNKIIGLFPDQLLQISEVLGYFSLYDIFGKVGDSVPDLLVMYAIFSIVIQPVIYGIYKKK